VPPRPRPIRVKPNWRDKLVGALFGPRRGVQHAVNRTLLGLDDGWDVTGGGRLHRNFRGVGGDADAHQPSATLWEIREQTRHHDRNSALLSGVLDLATNQILGGEDFHFRAGSSDHGWNRTTEAYITERMGEEHFHQTGELDFVEGSKLTLRAIWVDGDILHVETSPSGALQTFEAHELVTPLKRTVRIINGVGKNAKNQTVAYYVGKRTYKVWKNGWVADTHSAQRIPADRALFPAFRKRFNATRGIPYLASALARFDSLDDYLDSEIAAAQMNAKWGLKIPPDLSDDSDLPGYETRGSDPNATSNSSETFDQVLRMEAGQVFELNPGEDLAMVAADRPGDNFTPFTTMMAQIVGVGVGVPVILFLLDFSKVNYSSLRGGMQVVQRNWEGWQRFMRRRWCMPWYRRQIRRGIAARDLDPAPDGFTYEGRAIFPAWPWVDPEKEAKAFEIMLDNHIETLSEIIRRRGRDPEEVLREAGEDLQRLQRHGLERKRPTGTPQPARQDTED